MEYAHAMTIGEKDFTLLSMIGIMDIVKGWPKYWPRYLYISNQGEYGENHNRLPLQFAQTVLQYHLCHDIVLIFCEMMNTAIDFIF